NKDFDTRKLDAIDALWEQCTFFHAGKYKEAERFSAELLFEVAAYVLSMSIKQVPADYKRINNSRKILRKAILRYGIKTDLGSKPYKRTCYKLAYPEITKLKNKWKHALILFRRIIYG
ncbi:MAG: hypothetical protein IJL26_01325, partial [Clostridia bacterium]|nr:hypothetical protein [Clostridia bacterium]